MTLLGSPCLAQEPPELLKDLPTAYFSDEDFELLREALFAVLEGGASSSKTWRNDTTGNSGTIDIVKNSRTPDGRPCKQLRIENRAKALQATSTYLLCRSAEGAWQFDGDGL
jgi:hypothetical protein